jgi:hypothetical protein
MFRIYIHYYSYYIQLYLFIYNISNPDGMVVICRLLLVGHCFSDEGEQGLGWLGAASRAAGRWPAGMTMAAGTSGAARR